MVQEQIVRLDLPYFERGTKTVRVFIPEHEEGETFPVVYMTDGQNAFEEEVSSFGSWLTREAVRDERTQSGKAAIIVAIHNDGSPLERNNDLTPKSIGKINGLMMKLLAFPKPAGENFARFVTETVMPEVEKNFPVKTGRENTAFCGSSSGGLETFFIAMSYPQLFSAAGAFSPVFQLYSEKDLFPWIKSKITGEMPFLYLYCGGGDSKEKGIRKSEESTYGFLKECYPAGLLKEVYKADQLHNEAAWRPIFRDFLHIFLNGGRPE